MYSSVDGVDSPMDSRMPLTTFPRQRLVVLGLDLVRSVEHHDVAPVGVVQAVGELGDDHPIAHVELGDHRPRRDEEGLGHEGLDEEGDEHRRGHQHHALPHQAAGGETFFRTSRFDTLVRPTL